MGKVDTAAPESTDPKANHAVPGAASGIAATSDRTSAEPSVAAPTIGPELLIRLATEATEGVRGDKIVKAVLARLAKDAAKQPAVERTVTAESETNPGHRQPSSG